MNIAECIQLKLERVTQEQEIRILLACESGSRAWGFASPDSDYDVRLLYSHSLDWYLSLKEQRDSFESLDDVTTIDLAGWELRKALRLFGNSNPVIYEWLLSPIVYKQEEQFVGKLRALMPQYFNPRKAMHHYLGTARGVLKSYWDGERIGIKKAFYVLRPLAAAAWIRDFRHQPPTDFLTLLQQSPSPEIQALRSTIEELIHHKSGLMEKHPVVPPKALADFFNQGLSALEEQAAQLPTLEAPDYLPLERIFREFLKS
ncbi:MAG: nucleotidyltransferase domain-containing protein [Candidatus Sumerlaeia bacterium]|nr:nucleotidyltransferase domain-containing protein [Candidatus Sumerlaeia bacterium]